MNDSRELTLQERSTKRANYCLMLTVLIISIYMMFLFIGTILQGNHALFRLFVIAGMIALPAAVSTLFYFFKSSFHTLPQCRAYMLSDHL